MTPGAQNAIEHAASLLVALRNPEDAVAMLGVIENRNIPAQLRSSLQQILLKSFENPESVSLLIRMMQDKNTSKSDSASLKKFLTDIVNRTQDERILKALSNARDSQIKDAVKIRRSQLAGVTQPAVQSRGSQQPAVTVQVSPQTVRNNLPMGQAAQAALEMATANLSAKFCCRCNFNSDS